MGLYKNCPKNLIPCRTLVAMATERKNFKNLVPGVKISQPGDQQFSIEIYSKTFKNLIVENYKY